MTWDAAQLCHISWSLPCPAMCSPIPVTAVATNASGNSRSIMKAVFIFVRIWKERIEVSFGLKNTPCGQVLIHLLQPIQASASLKTACLCHRKPTFPITCFGHLSTHFQHAMQRLGFIATYFVVVLFIVISFFACKVKRFRRKRGCTEQGYTWIIRGFFAGTKWD